MVAKDGKKLKMSRVTEKEKQETIKVGDTVEYVGDRKYCLGFCGVVSMISSGGNYALVEDDIGKFGLPIEDLEVRS